MDVNLARLSEMESAHQPTTATIRSTESGAPEGLACPQEVKVNHDVTASVEDGSGYELRTAFFL
jgi:hypothetical protein